MAKESYHSNNQNRQINIMNAISRIAQKLLGSNSWEEPIHEVLSLIGQATEVSRVYIFENSYNEAGALVMSQRYEWVAKGISPQIDNPELQALPYKEMLAFQKPLSQNQQFYGIVSEMDSPIKDILSAQEILSILINPIHFDDKWWGFIGFDDCTQPRSWEEADRRSIHTLGSLLGSAIKQSLFRKETDLKKEYFSSLFDKAPEGIAIVSPEGQIEQINEEFTKLFNYTENEAVGRNIDDLIVAPEMMNEARDLTRSAARGDKVVAEGTRYTKDHVPVYVSIMGVPIRFEGESKGLYIIYRDISEQRMAEKNLQESQAKFKMLFESTTDGIFLMKDDIFVDCNSSATAIFETTEDELIGESPEKFSPLYQPNRKKSTDFFRDKIHAALHDIPQLFEFTFISAKGRQFVAEINLNAITLKENRFIQAILRDITERKQAEQELLLAKEKAEESDRLKTAFLASMSHEIRTPLNHILGGLDLLLDPEISHEEKEEFNEIIKNSSNQLLKLINDIIDVSHLESGQVEISKSAFSMKDILDDVKEIGEKCQAANPSVELQINTSGHTKLLDNIYSDRNRLKQVLTSLLSNAFKFTKQGTVEFGYSLKSTSMVEFYVSDTGIGIPEDSYELIFEHFRQVDYTHTREYEGAGLGLTLAKGIVELLGGDIWLKSELNKGTTFYFTISTKAPEVKQKPVAFTESANLQFDWSGKTILVVEDEEMNYQYLKTVLRKTNASILWAENGLKAVELASQNDIHLVLMDIQMPEMNGYEATRKILKMKPNTPIIAQTAHALKEERSKCINAGAVDYMSKPLNRKKLLNLIDKYIL
jgi:PAS domain S-box-containing protein